MESSPLTQQARPDIFEPKVTQLYLHIFSTEEDAVLPEGFWRELFLLKPDKKRLLDILDPLTADDLLHLQIQTQALFRRAVKELGSGVCPRDEHALDTLTTFLGAVLSKRYTNPSADAIEVLTGLDNADKLITELVGGLDGIIRTSSRLELRMKAIDTTLSLTSSAYQTGLVTYLTQRDLFPSLVKYIHEDEEHSFAPFVLLGLLANYNKFEFQNPYQNRLEDFVNEPAMTQIVHGVGKVCGQIRNSYVEVQDDWPEGWTWNSTLTFVGLRALSADPKAKAMPPTEEEAKEWFNALPKLQAPICLPTYSFVQANKLFAASLATTPARPKSEAPFAAYLSLTSYFAHHAHRSPRGTHYALLNLLSLRAMVEDQLLARRLCSGDVKLPVRLCRQRAPHLPLVTSDRIPASVMLDICTDTISHNLRRRLDVELIGLAIGIILRIVSHLGRSKTRLQHHWSYLWGALLSFVKFLAQYSGDLVHQYQIREEVCSPLTNLIAYCLSAGDSFLPDPGSYDDLFYKLVETGPTLTTFRDVYFGATRDAKDRSVNILISVSDHYRDLLQAQHGKKVHQSPAAVQSVIRQGYETLDIETNEDLGQWEKWREISWKAELKRIIRTVVEDVRKLVETS